MFAVGDRVEFTGGSYSKKYESIVGKLATVHKVSNNGFPYVDADDTNFPNNRNDNWPVGYWRVIDSSTSFIPEDWS